MSITIRDVAKRAGVGVGTVSRVLNNSPHVKNSTRQRVLTAITDLDYKPNQIARRLSLGKTLTIGAIVPTFTRPAFVERLRGVTDILRDSAYDLVIYSVETSEQRNNYLMKAALQNRVDGLIIISIQPTEEEAAYLAQLGIPVILIDAYHDALSCVYIDDIAGGCRATQHLIDLGHKKIGYISDYIVQPTANSATMLQGNHSMQQRYSGYCQALEMAGVLCDPSYHLQGSHSRHSARYLAKEILQRGRKRPTAIFAASDTQAFGVMEAARDLNLRIPQDLSLIGYDDIEMAEYLHLTTIRQSLHKSGLIGANLMLNSLKKLTDSQPQIELSTALITRQTTHKLSPEGD